jgi:energy-coupling factor transporter ATP-binding protein EcfA2
VRHWRMSRSRKIDMSRAVGPYNLRVPAGSFFGLVGPNGAGKTTSLSMAVGLLRPDGGTVKTFGRDVWADPVADRPLPPATQARRGQPGPASGAGQAPGADRVVAGLGAGGRRIPMAVTLVVDRLAPRNCAPVRS